MLLLLLGAAAQGCQTEPLPPRGGAAPRQVTGVDDCSLNMHDLAGYLLEHYTMHRALPGALEELRPLAGEKPLPLTCPASGKPYGYFPEGLVAPRERKQLIVADSEPSHEGKRWAIVTIPPEGKTPLGLWVVQLSEVAVQQFHLP